MLRWNSNLERPILDDDEIDRKWQKKFDRIYSQEQANAFFTYIITNSNFRKANNIIWNFRWL